MSSMHTVVVADDYENLARTTAEFIAGMLGVDAVGVTNGQLALDEVIAHHPHVVVLDVEMPVMGGIDAATAIRRLPGPPPLLIAVTGAGVEIMRGHHDKFDLVLKKPVELDALIEAISAGLHPATE